MSRLRFTSLRLRLIPWLILSLLLAQGLRLCIPAEAEPGHEAHAGVHLESLITATADQHETDSHDGDLDLPLTAMLKAFQADSMLFVLFVFVLELSLPRRNGPGFRPETLLFRPSRGFRLIPPLRAPPR